MSKQGNDQGQFGKVGGLVVKEMIETVEHRMAAGEHVSAAPSNQEEVRLLQNVKRQNAASTKGGA